jgi:STE24 endopeptidase
MFGSLVVTLAYWLLRLSPSFWWLYASMALAVLNMAMAGLLPVVVAPLFYRFTPVDDERLAARLAALASRAGTQVCGVFRFNMSRRTVSANAALMGWGPTRRIVLGDTLLDSFPHDEIEVVLAHELGHHIHHDIPLLITLNSGMMLAGLWLTDAVLQWGVNALALNTLSDPAGLPLLILTTGVFGFLTMPLSNAISRWRERMADRYALQATGKPQAFIDAMTRLANQNLADTEPTAWVVWLLYSHPPIRDRIAAARRVDGHASGNLP